MKVQLTSDPRQLSLDFDASVAEVEPVLGEDIKSGVQFVGNWRTDESSHRSLVPCVRSAVDAGSQRRRETMDVRRQLQDLGEVFLSVGRENPYRSTNVFVVDEKASGRPSVSTAPRLEGGRTSRRSP